MSADLHEIFVDLLRRLDELKRDRVVVIGETELETLLERVVAKVIAARAPAADDWVDAKTSPLGSPWTFRRLAAAGAFPTSRLGRKLVARRRDIDHYLEAQRIKTEQSTATEGIDPVERALAAGRLRVIGGAK